MADSCFSSSTACSSARSRKAPVPCPPEWRRVGIQSLRRLNFFQRFRDSGPDAANKCRTSGARLPSWDPASAPARIPVARLPRPTTSRNPQTRANYARRKANHPGPRAFRGSQCARVCFRGRHLRIFAQQVVTIGQPHIRFRILRIAHHCLREIIHRLVQSLRSAPLPVVNSLQVKLFRPGQGAAQRGAVPAPPRALARHRSPAEDARRTTVTAPTPPQSCAVITAA